MNLQSKSGLQFTPTYEEDLVDVDVLDESDATSEECESFHDSDYSLEEDDMIFNEVVDSTVEQIGIDRRKINNKFKGKSIEFGVVSNMAKISSDTQEDDCVASDDELISLHGDSDDENLKKSIVFYARRDLQDPKFEFAINMIFSNSKEFKWAVEVHAVMKKKDVKFKKNETSWSRAICKASNCKWFIYASKANEDEPFKIKTIGPDHSCGNQRENKTIDSGFLAKKYAEEFKINSSWGVKEFQAHVMRTHSCTLSRHQSCRAKKKTLDLIAGTKEDQFDMLWDYCAELRRSNPGTTCILKLDDNPTTMVKNRKRFLRLYVCFAACKQGFLAGCRPIIGVDGCHLKGYQKGGQLLTAVGIDANNNMYPIAFAIVEGELKETWKWFLILLDEDIRISQNPFAWTFISDKQKSLIPAFDETIPDVAHRFCVRHLHDNFKTEGFGGQALKDTLWKAARAITEPEFSKHMDEMSKINIEAPKWFVNKPPIHWSRAFFSSFTKCDILLNNMCESFNSVLLLARDQNILTMLESIRIYMMSRLQKGRDNMMKHRHIICPRILLKLEQNKDMAAECIAIKADQFHYQIEDIHLRLFSVDLKEKTCSCRRWDLTGIPCNHAIAAIWVKKDEPEMYVHECYRVEQYLKSYSPSILPINSSEQWPKTGVEPPLPPIYKAQPGRPKKLRKRGNDETTQKKSDPEKGTPLKASRKGRKKKCRTCGRTGHNSKKCPILLKNDQSEGQQQEIHQAVRKEGSSTHNNTTEVSSSLSENMTSVQHNSSFFTTQAANQLNEPREQPQQPLRNSAFILEEIGGQHSREDTTTHFIQRMGKQYVPLSRLQEALSQTNKKKE